MKCVVFISHDPVVTVTDFNEWAKDKPLAKDMIIHTEVLAMENGVYPDFAIVVFFDEKMHPSW